MKKLLLIIGFASLTYFSGAQELKSYEFPRGDIRFMFYNCENLFDTFDDSLKNDESFLPDREHYWTPSKYRKKLYNISKVIMATGQWEPPEIIGLCEIENRKVLNDLTKKTGLKKFNYRIIHKESPDKRGIDVAMLYRPDKFYPLIYKTFKITFPFDSDKPTRDILYVKGIDDFKDTLHIFINHWPSRWGGQNETDRKRRFVASVLRNIVDSLFSAENNPDIIIAGDLNDYPTNNSVIKDLKALTDFNNPKSEELYNLAWYLQEIKHQGSHKHAGEWGVLDQIIVSGNLLNKLNKLYTSPDNVHVLNAPFLLEDDNNYTGKKPFRTYTGFRFHDGYSDHLPVYLDLFRK
ncbi:MAG: endonuclease [Chlorobi bacterium]|nr:endonuclease [Chlorobiota bacterium]